MSRLYDTVEPAVVDEELLMRAVEEQGPKEEAGKVAKLEGIDFRDVFALRLDFKSKMNSRFISQELKGGTCTLHSSVVQHQSSNPKDPGFHPPVEQGNGQFFCYPSEPTVMHPAHTHICVHVKDPISILS